VNSPSRLSVVCAAFAGAASLLPAWGFDGNGNGLSDVWEQRYSAQSLAPAEDADGDGQSNGTEAANGTDPFDAQSRTEISSVQPAGGDIVLTVKTQPGKRYQIMRSPSLAAGSWTAEGTPQLATGSSREFHAPPGSDPASFFAVSVDDVDTDNDGVSDWEERQLPGFDPSNAQSAVAGQDDGVTLGQRLGTGANTVSFDAITATAYEKDGTVGALRITRTNGLAPLTISLTRSGNPNAQKGSASASDYRLEDAAGQPITDSVTLPFGATSVDLRVVPVADSLREVPEMLTLTIPASPKYQIGASSSAAVSICDASRDPANDRTFLAFLAPDSGVTSSASGISTVHLRGDNSEALVDLTFSSLTSAQAAAHIYAPGSGGDIKGLPRGQVSGSVWSIVAAQFFSTDQAVLDALFAGTISVNVLTGNYPDGEIRGPYLLSNGSANPPTPADPPPIETLTGEDLRRDIARFLIQSTFGPTQANIDALVDSVNDAGGNRIAAYTNWIDSQFALDQTRLLDYTQAADAQEWALRGTDPINYTSTTGEPGNNNRRRGWWLLAVQAHDQLRQRVTFALSEIFVISEVDSTVSAKHYGAANYYDMLGRYADGSYRALLGEISRSPMMGQYLSSLKNQKAKVDAGGNVLTSPDENYAREVMQLFSIGLVKLNADGSVNLGNAGAPTNTYTNTDITELARVFTGWSFSKSHGSKASGYPVQDNTSFTAGSGPAYFQASWLNPMKNFGANYHDTGAKTVLGVTIPAGLSGDADMDAALDILASHANTPTFISRLLIQRLVTSSPSAGYVYRVGKAFENDGTGQRGNLKAVVKAILLDPEARNPSIALDVGHGKQKEPIIRYVQLLRAFGAASKLPLSDLSAYGYPAGQLDNFPAGVTRYRYGNTDTNLAQTPLRSPTVFNWFLPRYSPGGAIAAAGLTAPEMQLTTETQVIQAINYGRSFTESDTGVGVSALFGATDTTLDDVKIDRVPFFNHYKAVIAAGGTIRDAVTATLDDADLLLTGGRLKERYASAPTPNPRSIIIDTVTATSSTSTNDTAIGDRHKALLYLLASSPTSIHQP
jgi:uncharacterized protein (DUF1800 family)